ncbi:flavin reductase family protein [Bacillus sp. FJAT-49736]|uniref:flavin reductase family protein n=1 Tax=Bacillus sp. FJAT-49736 TaxID=2833582 RepID=UPI001BCA059E|nr:flavin reductase family protein [Bacillus sp. FJAT-49736]MBS4172969.1 flavin reductase family protein [Bacillus sp. FJAT-49736]
MDQRDFRNAMGNFATGITVVTTEMDGKIEGMTVNAFMSVSLDPMLVVVSVDKQAPMYDILQQTKKYAVSILREDQEDLSMIFADQIPGKDVVEFDRLDGQPVLTNAITTVACEVQDMVKAGDHMLFIGKVTDISIQEGNPLLYFGGKYHHVKNID